MLNIFLITFSIEKSINRLEKLGCSLNKTAFSLADVEVKDTLAKKLGLDCTIFLPKKPI